VSLEIDTVGVVPIQVVLPALPPPGFCTGMSDVRRQAALLRDLANIEHRYGAVGLADAAATQADRLLGALPGYHVSDQVQRDWYRLAAELLASAGWYATDSGEPAAAGAHLRRALTLAVAAQGPMLQAHLNHVTAEQAIAVADPAQASALAAAGLRTTGSRLNPKIAAQAHLDVARAHAIGNGLPRALASIDRAHEALSRGNPSSTTPPWLSGLDHATIDAHTAAIHLHAGAYLQAAKYAQQALDAIPAGRVRDTALTTLDLVEAYLGQREIERAVTAATTALHLASCLSGGLRVGRAAGRLAGLVEQFTAWQHDVAVARDWVDIYRSMITDRIQVGLTGHHTTAAPSHVCVPGELVDV
jgi:tetratricopeptide (TPR) repeat protein